MSMSIYVYIYNNNIGDFLLQMFYVNMEFQLDLYHYNYIKCTT